MTKASGFGAGARLKDGEDFQRVFEQGKKTVGRFLILWHRVDPAERGPKLGLSVSSKVGGSVRRSRLKRLIRETFRLRRSELPAGLELVAYPRPGCPWKGRADAEREILDLLRRAGQLRSSEMKTLILAVLDLYRLAVRPFLPPACRFYPSCGDYAREAFSRHGVLSGARLTALRLARCHPFDPGGLDAVPSSPGKTLMDRNLWLAVALSAGVYLIWYGYFDKRVNPPHPVPVTSSQIAGASSAASPAGAPAGASAAAAPSENAPAETASSAAAPLPDAKAVLEHSDAVKLGDADALVSPRGAAIASYSFQGPISQVQLVVNPSEGLFATFPNLTFKRERSAKTGLVYAATLPDGVRIAKEYVPGQGTVLPRLVVTATNPSGRSVTLAPWTLTVGPGLGTVETEKKDNPKLTRTIGLTPENEGMNGKVETLKPGVHPGPYRWVAVDNRYFLAALLPSAEQFEPVTASSPAELTLTAKAVTLAPGGSFTWALPYYVGPKGYNWLARYGIGLERSVDLGWGFIAPIGRAMLESLVWLHRLIGNWGWAIIALTLILQAILAPLTYKSLKSAAMMRKVQPQITKLQARYKDDPTKLNTEMMALYKKGGANPLGGCMPMLLQMPIFYGLYDALRSSWELHGAGWIFWIKDLSDKDPYYVLPIVMGALMFLQSKLNPPAGDPTQQQMMMFMPLIFTFMFLKFPAGLVLYWLTNSLVSTLIQLAMRDRLNAMAAA